MLKTRMVLARRRSFLAVVNVTLSHCDNVSRSCNVEVAVTYILKILISIVKYYHSRHDHRITNIIETISNCMFANLFDSHLSKNTFKYDNVKVTSRWTTTMRTVISRRCIKNFKRRSTKYFLLECCPPHSVARCKINLFLVHICMHFFANCDKVGE